MDIIPSDLATYGSEAKKLLQDLQSRNERMFLVSFLVLNTADNPRQPVSYTHLVCHGLPAKEHHPGTQHEAVPACGAVQCTYHHEQSLHFVGQSRYAHRRLVRPSFLMPKEARHESDGNFQ